MSDLLAVQQHSYSKATTTPPLEFTYCFVCRLIRAAACMELTGHVGRAQVHVREGEEHENRFNVQVHIRVYTDEGARIKLLNVYYILIFYSIPT